MRVLKNVSHSQLQQQGSDEVGVNLLSRAGEEGWGELLGERGGYGGGFGGENEIGCR
jgi:hypothetical protein